MDVFSALADPTRQRIVELLARGDRDAGTIAADFVISRPAVSRHLRVLREAGVIEATADAQRRVYRIRPQAFDEIDRWVSRYREFWAQRLDDLAATLQINGQDEEERN